MKRRVPVVMAMCIVLLCTGALHAADSVSVTFRYTDAAGTAVRVFIPGEFNNWGPQSPPGVISTGAISEMQYSIAGGCWVKQVRLEIGKSYAYKFYLHLDATGATSQWLGDPLNPVADGTIYGNSIISTNVPLLFEPEAKRDSGGSTVKIIGGYFSTAPVQKVTLLVDSDSTTITSSFDNATGLISYALPSPVSPAHSLTLKVVDTSLRDVTYTFPRVVPSNRKLDVTFLFHANQNLVPYGKVGDRASFRGLLQTLRKHPTQKFQIHFSATTVHDLQWFNDTTLQILRAGIQAGQFEIFGSAYAQNVMYATRLDTNDFQFNDYQVKFQKAQIEKVLGVTPKAFWNPERVWTRNFVQLLADNGYEYIPVEDHILQASGATGPLYDVRTTHFNGRQLTVFEDDKQFLPLVDGAINSGDVSQVINFLNAKYTEDTADTYVVGYYQDAEATGLWDLEQGVNPQTNFDNLDKLLTAIEQDTLIKVTTYGEFLASNAPAADLTPIIDGAAAWMGSDAWFTENQDPAFQQMRATYDSLRDYLNSVSQAIAAYGGDTTAPGALLHHAWFTLCAHQFEFGCHGLQGDIYHAQLQLARTCAVAAAAASYAMSPTTSVSTADINRDGVNEIVMVTPQDLFVFSQYGGRLLYWFDLVKGEEIVGNEDFMSDYIEPYINDNHALPLIRGGIETYPWLGSTTILPEILGWTFVVRKRALNDWLTLAPAASVSLENAPYGVSINGTTVTFSNTYNGVNVQKVVTPTPTGIHVAYRLKSILGSPQSVLLEVQNSFSPSYLEVMDNGRNSLAYWGGPANGATQSVNPSTVGVVNTVTQSIAQFTWESAPNGLSGKEDVFGLELNPQFSATLNPGDSVSYNFSLSKARVSDAVASASPAVPDRTELFQNYPNPFNPKTVIRCQWSVVSDVRLGVYDVLGREVAVLIHGKKAPGRYEVEFDGSGLASGVYFYRLTAGDVVATKKLLLLK